MIPYPCKACGAEFESEGGNHLCNKCWESVSDETLLDFYNSKKALARAKSNKQYTDCYWAFLKLYTLCVAEALDKT